MACTFVHSNGILCGKNTLQTSNYCHNKSHYPTELEYKMIISNIIAKFQEDRIPSAHFQQSEVEADGACLFRSVANALFCICGNDLSSFIELMRNNEYFQMLPKQIKDTFLNEYSEIMDNFNDKSSFLDVDIETDIAIILQKMAVKYAISKSNIDVTEHLDGIEAIFGQSCTLQMFIENTHELELNEYIDLYNKFAGDDDYELEEKNITIKKGKRKGSKAKRRVKIAIQERWGGLPELLMYADMFDICFNVYIPQRLDSKTYKPIIAKKVCPNTYYYLVQQINFKNGVNSVNLSLRETKDGPHYEFLRSNAL